MPAPETLAPLPTLATHSPEAIERAWRDTVYQGDRVPQLTTRALITGALLGAVTGLSNLYVGLKLGWSLGVVITASILGWALWSGLAKARLLRGPPSVLEANAMASTASAAGYSTGTTLASAMAAHLMVTGQHLPVWQLGLWVLSISALGLFVAVPLKRALINVEQLPFPSGAAAAETLRSLYREPGDAARRARALIVALVVGVGVKAVIVVLPWGVAELSGPSWLALPSALPTAAMQQAVPVLASAAALGWALELSVLLPAAGMLMGWRVAWSVLLGAVVCFGMIAPGLVDAAIIPKASYRSVAAWSIWPGATMMVVAGMSTVVGRFPMIVRGLGSWGRRDRSADDPLADIEVPGRWVAIGGGTAALACIVLQVAWFQIPIIVAILAVVLAMGLAVVAARVTGETDVTPTGPLGKVAQLAGGVFMPGQVAPNLMAASVTAGAAASAADLLTDLKSGVLLGANPRKQLLAQAVGVIVGVIVVVPVFRFVVAADPTVLGSARFPAPAARIWASVSRVVGEGLGSIPSSAVWAVAVAFVVATTLSVLVSKRPAWRPWIPSPAGLGLAFVLPPSNAVSFFLGGLVAWMLARHKPALLLSRGVPIAAGLIAGESLMGIVEALLIAP